MRPIILALAALYQERDQMDEKIANLEAQLRGEQKPERIGAFPPVVKVEADENPPVKEDEEKPPQFFGNWTEKIVAYLNHFGESSLREMAEYFDSSYTAMYQRLAKVREKKLVKVRRSPHRGHPYRYRLNNQKVKQFKEAAPPLSKMQEATEVAMDYLMQHKGGPCYIGDIAEHTTQVTGRRYDKGYTCTLLRNTGRVTSDGLGNYQIVNLDTATLAGVGMRANALAAK